jgi:gluconolactonase
MKSFGGVLGVWCVMSSALLVGQSAATTPSAAETTAPDIPGVVAGGTRVQVLQSWEPALGGEAPVSMPDGSLLFSQQDLGRIIKIGSDGTFSTYLDTKPNQVLGLAYDLKGRLIAAHRGQPNGLLVLAPERSVLAESFEGQNFSSPNDLVIDQRGGVYFTDNVSEKATKAGGSAATAKPVEAVYYRTAAGQVLRVTEQPARPNGIQLSPDGKVLYVDSGSASFVTAFDVDGDGRLSHARNFAQLSDPGTAGGADGMAIDSAGRLYVAANGGIKVFGADGRALGTIPTSIKPRNLAFAGPDRKTLFIVTRGAAYKVAMLSEGVKGRAK